MRSLRILAAVALLIMIVAWIARAPDWLASNAGSADETERLIKKLAAEDPNAAKELTRLREKHDVRALTASFLEANNRRGTSGLRILADRARATGRAPYEVQLSEQALNPRLFSSRESRDSFLQAHGAVCQILDETYDTRKDLPDYLDRLDKAAEEPTRWRVVKDDPVALMIWDDLRDSELREFYIQERDWLAEIVVQLAPAARDSTDEGQHAGRKPGPAELIALARRYHPLLKKAIADPDVGPTVFQLFLSFGEVVRSAVNKHGLALDEVLEILYTNGDALSQNRNDEELAARLALLRQRKPSVWNEAREQPLALKLEADAPQYADGLLKHYAADDIAAFLYTSYPDAILPAAAAVNQYGDLAIYLLRKYSDDGQGRMPRFLNDPKIGMRVIPFLAMFGDQGLDRLQENLGWLDKHFDPDGKPKDKEWWTYIPGGAALDVARNWANGSPNEWSELGWGALDVADAALLIASFGGSSSVTIAKTTVTPGGQEVVEQISKTQGRKLVRGLGRDAARKSTVGMRKAAIEVARTRGPLLRRVARVGKTVQRGTRYALAFGKWTIREPARRATQAARTLFAGWKSVPANVKRLVYRSLLAVGLIITLKERTLPNLGKIGEAAGEFVGEVIKDTTDDVGRGLARAVTSTLGMSGLSRPREGIIYWIGLAVMVLAATFILLPVLGRGRVKHA
jgi:hypothetical protein